MWLRDIKKEQEKILGVMGMFIFLIVIMVTWLYTWIKIYQILQRAVYYI